MKKIKTTEAVGNVICHDITQIIKGEKKDVAFKKGHIVTEEDIPVLLSIGKDNLYVWEKKRRECFMKMKQRKFSVKYVKVTI